MSQLVGTQVEDAVVPKDSADTYPTHLSRYGKGGAHTDVADLTARDAIPVERREIGMRVYVLNVVGLEKEYQLQLGITNSDWVDVTTAGSPSPIIFSQSGVAPAAVASLNIGPKASHVYGKYILNIRKPAFFYTAEILIAAVNDGGAGFSFSQYAAQGDGISFITTLDASGANLLFKVTNSELTDSIEVVLHQIVKG